MKLTKKDKELEKILNQYPKKIDKDIVFITLLNWKEKSVIWLFYVTKIIELPEINLSEDEKISLQNLKNKTLEDKELSQKFNQLLEIQEKRENESDEGYLKIDKLGSLGFEPLLEEEALKLLSKTDWRYLDYNKTAYMLFDGDLTIKSSDTVLFYQVPIIINGNLTIEGELELPYSGRMLVLGDLHTENLYLWESVIYVQGTLFSEQLAMISSGDYVTQINNIKTIFLYLNGDNGLCINRKVDINIDNDEVCFSDIVIQLKESLLDKYYTIEDYENGYFEVYTSKIWEDLKLNKTIFKGNFLTKNRDNK